MSTLIRNGAVASDPYRPLDDDEALPPSGAILVSLARWQAEKAALQAGGREVAVRLPNTADAHALAPDLADASAVVLEFPSFADGRAYSQARILRSEHDYRGEIRATGGAVVIDHYQSMRRVGIDAFELRADQPVEAFLAGAGPFTIAYQPAADALPRVPELRRAAWRR
jgi:uncharacterized protein (DUF934 family)